MNLDNFMDIDENLKYLRENKKHITYSICVILIIATMLFVLWVLVVAALTIWKYRIEFMAILVVVFGVVGMFMKRNNKPPAFDFEYNKEMAKQEVKDAEDTRESIICSNMISVVEEAMEYKYPIVAPNRSNIQPPEDTSEDIIDKGSHVFYVVYVQTTDKVDREKFKTTLTNIITQRRKANELINLSNDTVPDYKGIGRSRLLIDSIVPVKDGGLLILCALASDNYFKYKQYQKKRVEQHTQLFDDTL